MHGHRDQGKRSWLVVGHGSVGSRLVRRLREHGEDDVVVHDPAPRVGLGDGDASADLAQLDWQVDYVLSCVSPAAALEVPDLIGPVVRPDSTLFDWNSVSPAKKQAIGERSPCRVIDVALLDTLDAELGAPRLAISGPASGDARGLLESLGFHVDVAGDALGEAAALKYARSIFMKSLESLCLEYVSLAADVDREGVVAASLANNLGDRFLAFMNVLVTTNRLHGRRRAGELAEAVGVFEEQGRSLPMARCAAAVLAQSAAKREEGKGTSFAVGVDAEPAAG